MSGPIIVGIDGSETSFKAASRAVSIALSLEAELSVVTAHAKDNTEVLRIGGDTFILDDAEQAKKLAERIAAKLRETAPGATINSVAVKGKPQEVLVEEAARSGAQLIVVGNVGMKGLGRVLGSVASSVAHSAPCDVYIVKTAQ
ncbi:universal stress protein [Cellulosimicrobium funkei]|nr:universal stress protein [Cellulosimicrobium funkei]